MAGRIPFVFSHTFSGLDQRSVDNHNTNYQYRIVEGTVDKNDNFTAAGKTITIDGNTYGVTVKAEATPKSETDSAGSSTGNTATANSETNSETGATTTPATAPDGTITGGSGKIELTNTLQNPKLHWISSRRTRKKAKMAKMCPWVVLSSSWKSWSNQPKENRR